jgi:ATP-binding cassette subfamily A (ABC1) protein 3
MNVSRFSDPTDVLTTCRSSLRGVTQCFAAVEFVSSPSEGSGGVWNYTLRADGALGQVIDVQSPNNDGEIYLLPLQHAVDYAIASINSTVNQAALPSSVLEYPYTDLTQSELQTKIRVA